MALCNFASSIQEAETVGLQARLWPEDEAWKGEEEAYSLQSGKELTKEHRQEYKPPSSN